MKKISTYLATALLLCAATACEDSLETKEETAPGTVENYVSVRILVPTGAPAGTRGTNDEKGEGRDNAVQNLYLYFFDGQQDESKCVGTSVIPVNDKDGTSGQQVFEENTYKGYKVIEGRKIPVNFTTENGYLVVMANRAPNGYGLGSKLGDAKSLTAKDGEFAFGWNPEDPNPKVDLLLMTSPLTERNPVAVNATCTKDNPAQFGNITLDRAIAAINYIPNSSQDQPANTFKVGTDEANQGYGATVTLTHYLPINQLNTAYYFMRTCNADGGDINYTTASTDELGNNNTTRYIMDPASAEKINPANNPDIKDWTDFRAKWYKQEGTGDVFRDLSTKTAKRIQFMPENGLKKDFQVKGLASGICFKAVYVPNQVMRSDGTTDTWENYTKGNDVYYYDQVLYKTADDVQKHGKMSDTQYEQYVKDGVIKIYKAEGDGVACYYDYFIKHNDNNIKGETGVMEYAIVRNHMYNLKVVKISGIGKPDKEIKDPGSSVEASDVYIQVSVTVNPWIVKDNEINF